MAELLLVANAGDGTISTLQLHREPEPRLAVLATSGDLPGCGTFAIDADRDLVHAAYKGRDGAPAGIATLRLDRESGALHELSRRDVEASMSYLTLAAGDHALLGVSYGGGFGAVWPIVGQGEGLGAPHSRFEGRHPHSIVETPPFVYAACLGDDEIRQFRWGTAGLDAAATDAAGGAAARALEPLDPPAAAAPSGSGPRHLVVRDADVYVVTEFSGEVLHYRRDGEGRLSLADARFVVDAGAGLTRSRLGADPREERLIWGADIHLSGDLVLTTERMSSELSANARTSAGGVGETVARVRTQEQPRGFAVTEDGRFAVVVGERSTEAALVEVGADGSLTQRDRAGIGRGANWVRFVR